MTELNCSSHGIRAVFPTESHRWQFAERLFLDTVKLAGFREVRISEWKYNGQTASCAAEAERIGELLSEQELFQGMPVKLSCSGLPEESDHLLMALLFGVKSSSAEAELISLAGDFLAILGILDTKIRISPDHTEGLKKHLEAMNLDFQANAEEPFQILLDGEVLCTGIRWEGRVPGTGFFIRMKQLLSVLESKQIQLPQPDPCQLYIIPDGEEAELSALAAAADLRNEGFSAECELVDLNEDQRNCYLQKINAQFTMLLGKKELDSGKAVICCHQTGECTEVEFGEDLSQFFYNSEIAELTGALDGVPFSFGTEE